MQRCATLLCALWILLLHVPPLGSRRIKTFRSSVRRPPEVGDVPEAGDAPEVGDVRLAGSKTPSQGRVEVYLYGQWGTVCHNGWDLPDAQVVCRQLHFAGAVAAAAGGTFGEGTGQIWLDRTKCVGTENSLSNCSYNGWGLRDCTHQQDAGVICVPGSGENSVDHSLELSGDLGELFDSEEGCDFLIHGHTYTDRTQDDGPREVVNTTVCAHRMILSRFPGFQASTDVQEISVNLTRTCRPHLPAFIRYAYTRKLEVTTATAECFHRLASHFGMRRLMEDAGRLLVRLLTEDGSILTQLSFYRYSVGAGDRVLRENCLQYLAWNFQNLSASEAWGSVPAELLEALLSRSDLVVPAETSVLAALEAWVSRGDRTGGGEEQQAALLAHVRFPMIPAEELLELPFTSTLYSAHRALYQEKLLKAFQAHSLPFGTLKNSSAFQRNDRDYQPRIYSGPPWGVKPVPQPNYGYSYGGGYGGFGGNSQQSHRTPVHTSAVFAGKTVDWQLDLFNNQYECSNRGLHCDSLPAARMRMYSQAQGGVRYSNLLLLSCQGRFIFHIVDFKDDFAYVPAGKNATYPCADEGYNYYFVVRPEYI